MRKLALLAPVIAVTAVSLIAGSPPNAGQVLAAAEARAASEHKAVFLHFGASWCGWCRRLDGFLEARQVRPILDKYFVFADLVVQEHAATKSLENPDAEAMLRQLGGARPGIPFFALLDANGQLIVSSIQPAPGKPEGVNIGYPRSWDEIAWMISMIRMAATDITPAELKIIDDWLKQPPA